MEEILALPPPVVLMEGANCVPASGQCDCDCDCACSEAPVSTTGKSWAELKTLPLRQAALQHLALNDEYRVVYQAAQRPVVLNQAAWQILSAFEPARKVSDLPASWQEVAAQNQALERCVAAGLLRPADQPAALPVSQPELLTAWLHVTDRCNLRCAYCYLPHVKEDMSMETGKAAVDATLRSALRHGYRRVKLKYAGGEPLLRLEYVLALHAYAREQILRAGLELDAVVLSNGTRLTEEAARALQTQGLRLMISLDGLGSQHDYQRPYVNGRGSSQDVLAAVETAQACGLAVDISITVSRHSAPGLAVLVEWVLEHDLNFSLNFYRENELSAGKEELRLDEDEIIAGMLAAFAKVEAHLPRRSLLAALVDRANLASPHEHACSAGTSYLVFNQHGQVSQCQMAMRAIVSDVHAPDPLAQVRTADSGLFNLPVLSKSGCSTCEWKYWCAGGCPLMTQRAFGQVDRPSPNCRIYKALFPAAVRLEGLRLLKYAAYLA